MFINCCPNVADHPNTKCPNCNTYMTKQVREGHCDVHGDGDLEVKPLSTISRIAALNRFSMKDVGALKEKVINVSINEALEMLKTSLYSKNVFTDVFLSNPSS